MGAQPSFHFGFVRTSTTGLLNEGYQFINSEKPADP